MISREQHMADEQRKSVALEYFERLDTGGDFFELFADGTRVYLPKWGVVHGRTEIEKLFGDVGSTLSSIEHHYERFNCVINGDVVVVEGTSHGATADRIEWRGEGDTGGALLRRLRDPRRQNTAPLHLLGP